MTPSGRRPSAPGRARSKPQLRTHFEAQSDSQVLHTSEKDAKVKDRTSDEPGLETVVFGNLILKPWYQSYYPEEIVDPATKQLLVCPFCFKYAVETENMIVHTNHCQFARNPPPGKLIYSHHPYQIYEIDGEDEKLYAQNLSLFGKLFLETKSVFFDVTIFLFYVLVYIGPCPELGLSSSEKVLVPRSRPETETRKSRRTTVLKNGVGGDYLSSDSENPRVVGFFSKEKISWDGNNLACILVFPPWQSQGFGQILMATSYELSRRDGKPGGPEKPLSDLGRRGYISFWSRSIARFLLDQNEGAKISVQDISDHTFILASDIMTTVEYMGFITHDNNSSGTEASTSTDSHTKTARRTLKVNKALIRAWQDRLNIRLEPSISPDGFLIGYTKRGVNYAIQVRRRLLGGASQS